jgi:curved DNA-binding protein CbpA
MFKDYYQLLGISPSATKQEIKQAYRSKSLQWHPDRNPGVDVTAMMQDINEAYRILNDDISRARYDKEYEKFTQKREQSRPISESPKYESWNYDYEVKDDDLRNDINEARKYAKDLVEEFFKNLKETSKAAAKGAWDGAYGYIVGGIIATVIFALIRACH